MSFFVSPTSAPPAKTPLAERVAVAVAGLFVVLAVGQLFEFENFPTTLYDMWLPGVSQGLAALVAALVVTFEILAIPFLLRMRLSPLMRVVSMVASWLVGLWWLVVLTWQNLNPSALTNNGLLGSVAELPVGWWSVTLMLAVGVLIAWASWGLWPFGRRST
jgi:hypothetical protein